MNFLRKTFGLSVTAAVMCLAIAGLFCFFLIAGMLVTCLVFPFEAPLPFGIGLGAGCLLSAFKVVLLEKTLYKSADIAEQKSAQNYAHLQAILRYFLTAVVLLGAVLLPRVFGLFGLIFGILSLQLSAYIASFVLKRMNVDDIVKEHK